MTTPAVDLFSRLDSTIDRMMELIAAEIYDKTIVCTVRDWFEGRDSITALNESLKKNIQARWPLVDSCIKRELRRFAAELQNDPYIPRSLREQQLDPSAVADPVSQTVTTAIGAVSAAIMGMICGGTGIALIASGPAGWIAGFVLGTVVFILFGKKVGEHVRNFIVDKPLPVLLKRTAKGKIIAQLQLKRLEFEKDIHEILTRELQPAFRALTDGLGQ